MFAVRSSFSPFHAIYLALPFSSSMFVVCTTLDAFNDIIHIATVKDSSNPVCSFQVACHFYSPVMEDESEKR